MKKYVLLMVWLFSMPMALKGQNDIYGRVTDYENQTPLPGANVVVKGSHSGTFADSHGGFALRDVSDGEYTLEVSYLGYSTREYVVDVPLTDSLHLALVLQTTLTGEVVVMANRASGRMAATYSNLNREDLMPDNLGQDLPVLINMTPSIIVSTDAGAGVGYSWMNIRGSDQSRINVTLNGIPLNDAESHGVWWVNMPDVVSSTDNLQIQRGVGLSTHGSGAFGASISLQTNVLRDKTYAEVSSSAGSFNTMKNSLGFGTGLINGRWAFDGRLSRIKSDGYVDRASAALDSYYLSGGFYGSNTMIKLLTFSGRERTYQAWNGVPSDSLATNRRFNPSGMYHSQQGELRFYDNETDNYQQNHYQMHASRMLVPELTANLSLHYTYGRGYYEQYRENERFNRYDLPSVVIGDQTISRSDLIRRRWLDNHFYGLTYSLNYNNFGKTTANLGGGLHYYDGDHFGEIIWARYAQSANIRHRYYDNNGFKRDFNSYIKITHEPIPGLQGFADLQYRFVSYDFLGLAWVLGELQPLEQNVQFHFFNPKAGISYDIDPSQRVYAYFGIANREPVRHDFTDSSPESRPRHETMYNTELGYRFSKNRFMFAANTYLMNYKDQLVLTGEINDTGAYTRTNIDKSYRAGIELELRYIFNNFLQWNGNLTWSRNKINNYIEFSDQYDENWNWVGTTAREYTNTDIAFSPSRIAASSFTFSPLKDLDISLQSKFVGERYIDNTMNRERMLDAYFVNDLRLNYHISTSMIRDIELVFKLNNVFDVMYETNAWIYKGEVGANGLVVIEDGYFPQAGRHFLAGINLRF